MESFKVLLYDPSVCELASYLCFYTMDAFGVLICRLSEPKMSEHKIPA